MKPDGCCSWKSTPSLSFIGKPSPKVHSEILSFSLRASEQVTVIKYMIAWHALGRRLEINTYAGVPLPVFSTFGEIGLNRLEYKISNNRELVI